jgi:hypothetical protein
MSLLLLTAAAIIGSGVSACFSRSSLNPLELELTNRLGSTNCVLGATFANWTNVLGAPSVVTQRDEGNTFFYWPSHGIGVFCHPLYRGQYRSKTRPEWVVTSILVPLHTNVHARIPPVEPDIRIGFTKLLFSREEVVQKGWARLHKVEAFQESGVLESLVIERPDSWFGDYD